MDAEDVVEQLSLSEGGRKGCLGRLCSVCIFIRYIDLKYFHIKSQLNCIETAYFREESEKKVVFDRVFA